MDKPDILVRHAKNNVWGEPGQDFNHNINLLRLTPDGGVMTSFTYRFLKIYTPTHGSTREWFHIYQIGQLPPLLFDMLPKLDIWTPIIDVCIPQSLLIDVYLTSGGVVPHHQVWIMKDRTRNILVCIKRDRKIDFGIDRRADEYTGIVTEKKIYLDIDKANIRFYSNLYHSTNQFRNWSVDPEHPIEIVHRSIYSMTDWAVLHSEVSDLKAKYGNHGFSVWYEDGFVVNEPMGYSDKMLGKHYTVYWDETFKARLFFSLDGLPAFRSKKDYGARKYLLVTDNVYDEIDFYDDVDFYVVKRTNNEFKGVYVSRMLKNAFRMVSHNSYAIDAELIEGYIDIHEFLGQVSDCSIMVNIRRGGMSTGLINQKNRIEELYQLPYDEILKAYTNTLSLIPEWNAVELEQSAYTSLISADVDDITPSLVEQAYGYSAIVDAVSYPIQPINDNQVIVPPALCIPHIDTKAGNRSVFVYNQDGMLLGYQNDSSLDNRVILANQYINAVTAEVFNMTTDDDAGVWVNCDVVSNRLDQYGFSCFVSTEKNGTIAEVWEDVTEQTAYYTYTPNDKNTKATIQWNWGLLTQAGLYPAVKTNDKIAIHKAVIKQSDFDGCINIDCMARQYWHDSYVVRSNSVPCAVVDVFINGYSLVENIDYINHWPRIVLLNRWFAKNDTNSIVIRSYGCGNGTTSSPFAPREIGFIKEGMLSINGVYDVRNDKPLRVIYNNQLRLKDQVKFGETDTGPLLTDGRPYGILDYITPIEPFTTGRTSQMYLETADIDTRVSNYLTMYLPENPAPLPKVESYRWELYSPLIASLIVAMKKGYISDASTGNNFTSAEVDQWIKPYKWLFAYDPAYLDFNKNYFYISPHPFEETISITEKQYELLRLVNVLYLNNRVNFTPFITISDIGGTYQ